MSLLSPCRAWARRPFRGPHSWRAQAGASHSRDLPASPLGLERLCHTLCFLFPSAVSRDGLSTRVGQGKPLCKAAVGPNALVPSNVSQATRCHGGCAVPGRGCPWGRYSLFAAALLGRVTPAPETLASLPPAAVTSRLTVLGPWPGADLPGPQPTSLDRTVSVLRATGRKVLPGTRALRGKTGAGPSPRVGRCRPQPHGHRASSAGPTRPDPARTPRRPAPLREPARRGYGRGNLPARGAGPRRASVTATRSPTGGHAGRAGGLPLSQQNSPIPCQSPPNVFSWWPRIGALVTPSQGEAPGTLSSPSPPPAPARGSEGPRGSPVPHSSPWVPGWTHSAG